MRNLIKEHRMERGWSQAELARRLGVSRQAVNAFEVGRSEPSLRTAFRLSWLFDRAIEELFVADLEERMEALEQAWERQERLATAFDEIGVLEDMGRQGWELVSFGPLKLSFRRPEDPELRVPWSYQRVNGSLSDRRREAIEADGWVFCGSWMNVFHFFKRRQDGPEARRARA